MEMAIRPSSRSFTLLMLSCTLVPAVSYAQKIPTNLYREMQWRLVGPFRAGRTIAVAGIPDEPNVFYMAPNNGGVWKTTDYGHVWKPIFDGQPTGSVGCIAIAPSDPNIIYVGSGEGVQRPDLSAGDGIYKSADAGKTWTHLGLRDGQQIARLLIDPKDPNRVFAAVLGHPYGANAERGVFLSTDGGDSWKKVLYKDEDTGAMDLAFDPANSQTVYASLWSARQTPWEGGSVDGPGSGLFKSIDGGATWHPLTKGLPTIQQGLGRIGFTIAPTDSRRMYADVDAGPLTGVYRSDDAGDSWIRVNSEQRVTGRGQDFAWVRVDPHKPDVVYAVNTSLYRSDDGGHTFTAIKGAPGGDDYHAIWINPEHPQILLLGVDQGATVSVNGGETWSSWYNQPTAQLYHVSTDNQFPYWIYGGQQESGSVGIASRSDYGQITFRDWHPVGVEEYGYVAPDPLHPNIIYGGKGSRYDSRTGSVQNVGPAVTRGSGDFRFVRTAPMLFSYVDPHVLYLGSQNVLKTTNGGDNWEAISPDLSRPSYKIPENFGNFRSMDPEKGHHRGVVYTIAPSHKNVDVLWAGTDDGLIHMTRDGGNTWKDVTPPELTPWSKVSLLDSSHFDDETAYAAINRFRLDDLRPAAYRTHDGGKHWTSIVHGLPEGAVVNAVREDPVRKGLLYAGTEIGVFVSFNDGDDWQPLQLNLPVTSIRDLVIHEDDLVVATHGRSFWVLDDLTPLRQMKASIQGQPFHLFEPALANRMRRNQNTDTPLPPEEPAGKNPPDGAILDFYLKDTSSSPVLLEILDGSGTVVRRYSSTDSAEPDDPLNVPTYWVRLPRSLPSSPGMHRFIWDLRYAPPGALSHEYPISAIYGDTPREPLGVLVLPGTYRVRLTVEGKSEEHPLRVAMDPRIPASAMDLKKQFDLSLGISVKMDQTIQAIGEVRSLRKELTAVATRTTDAALIQAIQELEQKAASIEGQRGRFRGAAAGGNSARSLSRANGVLAQIYGVLNNADASPTTQAVEAVTDAEATADAALAEWNGIKTHEVPALNDQLRHSQLSPVALHAEIVTDAENQDSEGDEP